MELHAVPVLAVLMIRAAPDFAVAWLAAAFADHDAVVQPVDSCLAYSVVALAEHVLVAAPDGFSSVMFWVADESWVVHYAVAVQVVLLPTYFASGIEHLNVSLSLV